MDTNNKKEWEKPQLIVLVRSRPEEAVLFACKLEVNGSGGADFNNDMCHSTNPTVCPGPCSATVGS